MALQHDGEPARRHSFASDDDDRSSVRIALVPSEPPPPWPPPAPSPRDPFEHAAHAADGSRVPAELGGFWQEFMDRRLKLATPDEDATYARADRRYVFARPQACGGSLNRLETAVLVRVLCGEQQKFIAAELGIACSTASKWFTASLFKLGLDRNPIPLPLIIAAQAWALGDASRVEARSAMCPDAGGEVVALSVPTARVRNTRLTVAEEDVARLLIEGDSRLDIADQRNTSAQTVACQLRGVYSKLGVSGRYALVRRGVELGWFV
jgi:DNA-binding NarL/FixJ family response regulator